MARKLPAKDVVIIGLGWTGSILAYELAKAGLDVVAIERGPWRDTATDFAPATTQDELRYAIRLDLFLRHGVWNALNFAPGRYQRTLKSLRNGIAAPI